MRHISRAMVLNCGQEGSTTTYGSGKGGSFDNGIVNVSRPPSPNLGTSSKDRSQANSDALLNMLPSEPITRGLIEKYFSDTGNLFPYIHAPSFLETYEQMISANFTKMRRTWLGLLNMVMAMASNVNSHQIGGQLASERLVQSDEFYKRALDLCQTQILRGSSLETGIFCLSSNVIFAYVCSTIFTSDESVLARNAKVCTNMDNTRSCRQSGYVDRSSLG